MRPKVMLVDDEPHVTAALQRGLRREPYDIVTAHSADEALEVMDQERIDVVVSDERMPNMLGSEFLSIVRRDYPDTVRIILTGQASLEAAMRAINEGQVYRFLSKPCEDGELTQAIAGGLGQRGGGQKQSEEQAPPHLRTSAIQELEAENPGITEVQRDQDGAIIIDDIDTDLDTWKRTLNAAIALQEKRYLKT